MNSRTAWFVTLGLLLASAHPASAREWTDKTGKFSVEADLVRVKEGKAILKKADGKIVAVPVADLSAADRRYLARLKSPQNKPDDRGPEDSESRPEDPPETTTPNPSVPVPAWTTSLAKMKSADQPLLGKLHGQRFVPDNIELSNGILRLKEGDEIASGSRKVTIFLFQDEGADLRGKTFRLQASKDFGQQLHVHMTYEKEGSNFGETKMFMNQCALLLSFGQSKNGRLPGHLYLCLPDKEKSVVAGSFAVDVYDETHPEATASKISGRVIVRGKSQGLDLHVGCYGKDREGDLEGPASFFEIGGPFSSTTNTNYAPRFSSLTWDKDAGAGTHEHLNRAAGHYLVYAQGRSTTDKSGRITWEGYYDWKWVKLESDDAQVEVDLTIDPANSGSVEVTVEGSVAKDLVTYVPLDEQGELPWPELSSYVRGTTGVKLEDGKAVVHGLRPGKYRFATVGRRGRQNTIATADVEVKRDETSNVEMVVTAPAKQPARGRSTERRPESTGSPRSPSELRPKPKKTTPAGQPDLQVTRVFLNEGGYLRARFRNSGTAPATQVHVGFFVDETLQGTSRTPTLRPGMERLASSGKLREGSHTVKVVVDPDDTIAESDESNNSMEVKLSWPHAKDNSSDANPQTDLESAPLAVNVEDTDEAIPPLVEPPIHATLPASPPVSQGDEAIPPLIEPAGNATPSHLLANVANGIAGLGSLGCFILVLVHLFQSDQKALGITCIILVFVCGIGALIAFVKGWMDDVGTVMWVWSGCIALGVLTSFVLRVGG